MHRYSAVSQSSLFSADRDPWHDLRVYLGSKKNKHMIANSYYDPRRDFIPNSCKITGNQALNTRILSSLAHPLAVNVTSTVLLCRTKPIRSSLIRGKSCIPKDRNLSRLFNESLIEGHRI